MKFVLASLIWASMCAVLGFGLWLMIAKGSPWLLIISSIAFVGAIAKIGCPTH